MSIALFAAAAATLLSVNSNNVVVFSPYADRPFEQCGFGRIAATVDGSEYWHDLGPSTITDPDLARELADIMPGFRLAYLNRANMGLLLVGGGRFDEAAFAISKSVEYWREAEQETRAACDASGVACEVAALDDAPYGLSAMTRIDEGADAFRRETLAFPGEDGCTYSLQFSSPESALSEPEWQAVRDGLRNLRTLLAPPRQANR